MQNIENYFNNVDQIIGKKIYFLRLDNNMSQAEKVCYQVQLIR